MDCKQYKVTVPGSLMLFGEHAVLHGKCSVVTAINKYIYITLIPSRDRNIKINSSYFGVHTTALDNFTVIKPYNFILISIKQYLTKINSGFTLNIESDFSATIGFGSSAAVTVATLGVLALWLEGKKIDLLNIYKKAVHVIRLAQNGMGSGADVAASVFGGIIAYKLRPLTIEKIGNKLQLVVIYSGSKTPTPIVISKIEKERKKFPKIHSCLYNAIDCCTKKAIVAIKNKNLVDFGRLMDIHHGLQDSLGTNNKALSELIFALRAEKTIYGAKISGAGLGDCVIGLGKSKKSDLKQISVLVSNNGLKCISNKKKIIG